MKFGVFDHMDRGGADLGRQFDERLRLIELYEQRGLSRLSPGRASCHAARHGALAQRVPGRGGAAHQDAALRAAGLHGQPLSSAAADRRDLHARPDERRPARARHRPRHLALRGGLLRRRSRHRAGALRRGARGDPEGPHREAAQPSRQILHLRGRADGDAAGAASPSAAVVRRQFAGERRPAGQAGLQHRGRHEGRRRRPVRRPLPRRLEGAGPRRGRHCR